MVVARGRAAGGALGVLAALAAAAVLGLAAAQPPVPSPLPMELICGTLKGLNTQAYNPELCGGVNLFVVALVNTQPDTCADKNATGYGKQKEPPALSAADLPKSVASKPAPLPIKGKPPVEYKSTRIEKLLQKEGATYNWLFVAIRNLKHWWSCSKQMGGSLDGYLIPKGWEGVGGTKAPGSGAVLQPGVYNMVQQDNVSYPMMAVLRQKADAAPKGVKQMAVLIRGSNTAPEWKMDVMYDRVSWKGADGTPRAFTGVPFAGNSFSGKTWTGETHKGFTIVFDALWPQLQAALKAAVVDANKATAPTAITFGGHSLGGAITQMLALAAKYYLKANKKSSVAISVVTFGAPSFSNSALLKELNKNVLTRRIEYENDLFSILPCTSPVKPEPGQSESYAMPACANTLVPTPHPDPSKWYWRDYGVANGAIVIKSADMPAQALQWDDVKNVYWEASQVAMFRKNNYIAHVCSYNCYLWKYSAREAGELDQCLINGPAAGGHGVCPWETDGASTS